ncbi:uncharacterized protein BCR38DRAFT_424486 [Pseudomassariella vexata]|uniref:Rhodopsin domain-containing protein n=1 Tax=Pseudomassariella vexata TaxID=1141098 RepID=A0A1Y2EDF9_9PEZI|nr:uncharacterized protein BCR38DRAFT_424486 [Pseudomassariella vexata]ORY68845.1 hypothetical protein BCR38DRAFT_424486 [Pseudomassariella vexata]
MPMTKGVLTLLPAPEGYNVDFAHPQRQAEIETYWVAAVGNFLALLFIGQRVYTKLAVLRTFQLEDGFLVAAWITSIGTQAVLLHMFSVGVVGVHAWEISLDQYNFYSILILVAPVIYAPCSGFAKLTLLLFYRRISPQTWFQWSITTMICIVVGYTIVIFFSLIFACNPIAKNWDITITEGYCINRAALYIVTAVLGILTDVILLVLPIPMVLGLQMPNLQKAGLLLMFTIGSLTVVTSIVRLVILLPVLTNTDQPWAIAFPCTWICAEANLLVICCSLPTLRKFFRDVAPKIIGESDNSPSAPTHFPGHTNLRTFGRSSNKRKQYNKFGESEYGMMTLNEEPSDHNLRGDRDRMQRRKNQVDAGSADKGHTWDAGSRGDGDSVRAIVQTKTMTVFYSDEENHN